MGLLPTFPYLCPMAFPLRLTKLAHTLLLATLAWALPTATATAQTEFNASGFGVMRIENEAKIAVPDQDVERLWTYLSSYIPSKDFILEKQDTAFSAKMAEDIFVDQYFDNEDMQLLKAQNGVRHRSRVVLTNANDRKNGRELMQIKISDIGDGELSRAEYKYPIAHYDKLDHPGDDHPFLGLVDRDSRDIIMKQLTEYKIDPYSLFPTILLEQNRRRVYILYAGQPFATATLDRVTGIYQDQTVHFTELELELNEINYTEADSAGRERMRHYNTLLQDDIAHNFPSLKQDQTPKYNKAFNRMKIDAYQAPPSKERFAYTFMGILGGMILFIVILVIPRRRK